LSNADKEAVGLIPALELASQTRMANKMAQFFISMEMQTHAIEKLVKLKQGN